jgi:hypothetical protein
MVVSGCGSRGVVGAGGGMARISGGGVAGCFLSGGSAATKAAPRTKPSMIHDGVFDIFAGAVE